MSDISEENFEMYKETFDCFCHNKGSTVYVRKLEQVLHCVGYNPTVREMREYMFMLVLLAMVYVKVKEETAERLQLSREPSNTSWALLIGFCAFGLGAALYGNDHILWKIVYLSLGALVGISCLEDWEECDFNKKSGEIRLKRHSAWDLILSPFTHKDNVIVANLPDVTGIRVAEEKVNYFGNTHQVVLDMSTGMSLGITESFTFGSTKEHYQIADKIRNFLGLDNVQSEPQQWDQANEESSSSTEDDTADDFEQIDKSELLDETIDTADVDKDKDQGSGNKD